MQVYSKKKVLGLLSGRVKDLHHQKCGLSCRGLTCFDQKMNKLMNKDGYMKLDKMFVAIQTSQIQI